jgi:hypothetical protein
VGAPERIYGGTVRAFSIVILGLGVAMIAATLGAGGGALSTGVLMGVAFVAVGVGRIYIASRGGR